MPTYAKYSGITGNVGIVWPLLAPLGSAAAPSYSFALDPNTGIFSSGADTLNFSTNGTERMRIDSAGNVLVNYTTLRTNFYNGTVNSGRIAVEGTSLTSGMTQVRNANSVAGSYLVLGKTRSATNGGNTIVQTGDDVGVVSFQASDGTNLIETGAVQGIVTGTPAAGNVAGALVFRTNTGSTSSGERMRLDSSGRLIVGNSSVTTPLFSSTYLTIASNTTSNAVFDSYIGSGTAGGFIAMRTARGTQSAPTATQLNDALGYFQFRGYGTSQFSGSCAEIAIRAAENFTNSANGSYITFSTVPAGFTTQVERMRITDVGSVGIGGGTPANANDRLHIFGVGGTNTFIKNRTTAAIPVFRGERQNGTTASPTAIVSGNELMNVSAGGYDGAAFSTGRAGLSMFAAENWTNAAQGAELRLYTTPTGSTTQTERMRIDSAGNVGVKATSFGTSAEAAFGIANGTEPSTSVADQIVMGSVDLTAGNTIPYFRSEGTGMTGAGITNTTVTHKIAIKVNGTVYYLLATTNGT